MKHLGDITKINGAEIEIVDCISFGSPCQDLSISGLRKGLSGERSGLFMEAVRIFKEMRKHEQELRMRGADEHIRHFRYAIWENVEGAFSSNNGEDFRVVLEELCRVSEPTFNVPKCNGRWAKSGCIVGSTWSVAWLLHDAQYFGVPQRRKRVCVLCDFDGRTAGEILLFEQFKSSDCTDTEQVELGVRGRSGREIQSVGESCTRNFEAFQLPWKNIARNPKESTTEHSYTMLLRHTGTDTRGGGVGALINDEISSTLNTQKDQTLFQVDRNRL